MKYLQKTSLLENLPYTLMQQDAFEMKRALSKDAKTKGVIIYLIQHVCFCDVLQ